MRGFGELEQAIMDRLWERGEPATVREVHTELSADRLSEGRQIAYTTVLTVMDNLLKKGWLTRERDGRAHRYQPTASRGEYGARLVREALTVSGDPAGSLLRLVDALSPGEQAALREALAAHDTGAARDTGEPGGGVA